MIIKTRGIVFKVTKFRETSIITHILTEEVGLSSYIVNGVRSSKSKFNIGYFEPLSLVEMTAYHNPDRDINRINEIKTAYPLHSIRQNMAKSAIIMFLAEVLNKCIAVHDENNQLFDFIFSALVEFDEVEKNNNFHLQFLFRLSSFLGFGLQTPDDLIKASNNPAFYVSKEIKNAVSNLIGGDLRYQFPISNEERTAILGDLINYYQLHIGLNKLKSLAVLNAVFC